MEYQSTDKKRSIASYGCFLAAIMLTIVSCQADPKENFFVPGAIQLLGNAPEDKEEPRTYEPLTVDALIARSVGEDFADQSVTDQIENVGASVNTADVNDLLINHNSVSTEDFAITTLPEAAALLELDNEDAQVFDYGVTPLVLATNTNFAAALEQKGITTEEGPDVYTVDVEKLVEFLSTEPQWSDVGAEGSNDDPLTVTAPDPSADPITAVWAQTIALASADADAFPDVETARQWAQLPEVTNFSFTEDTTSAEVVRLAGNRSDRVPDQLVVTTEADVSTTLLTSRQPIAVLYPDIRLGKKLSFVALTHEGKRFHDRLQAEAHTPPFHHEMRRNFSRYRDSNGTVMLPTNLDETVDNSLELDSIGEPKAVQAFNAALASEIRRQS